MPAPAHESLPDNLAPPPTAARDFRAASGGQPHSDPTARLDRLVAPAGVVKLADTQDLGSCASGRVGSSPTFRTRVRRSTASTRPPTVTTDGNSLAQHRTHPLARPRDDHRRGRPLGLLVVCFIVFAETGLLVGFLLPGDTLLVISGLLTNTSNIFGVNIWVVSLLIALSAFIGGEVGYFIGHKGGPAVFERKESGALQRQERRAHERVLRALRRADDHPRPLRADRAHVRPGRRGRRAHAVAPVHAVQLHRRDAVGLRPHDARLRDRLHPVGRRPRRPSTSTSSC